VSRGLDYELWSLQHAAGESELGSIRNEVEALGEPPLISVVLVAGEWDELWVAEGVDSLARQSYPHWELCAAQFGTRAAIDDAIAGRLPADAAVRRCDAPACSSPASALACALALAGGEYVLVLDEGDTLSPDALLRLVDAIHRTGADLLYSNQDRIDAQGVSSVPVFKAGFSPDRLLCAPYLGRFCALRTELVEVVGGIRPQLGAAAEHDLLLRVSERAQQVAHLPQILYHRRVLAETDRRAIAGGPGAPSSDRTVAVVEEALGRRGEPAIARADRESGIARVVRQPPEDATVSLILRSDRRATQLPLLRELDRRSLVRVDEVIVAGERPARSSGLSVVEDPCPARAANRAAAEASGDVLIFCSQAASLPPTTGPRWVGELVAQAVRPGIGAVSGTVVDPDGRLRHGGLRVDLEGLAGPVWRETDVEPLSTAWPINPGGATGELLAIERDTFERAGGFDAEHLPGSLFALDLAFRLEEHGLISVYTPVAQVQCHDARSFPSPEEIEHMWSRWASRINRLLDYERSPLDPHRSPLAPERSDCASFVTGPIEVAA
jgi:O-antigen biosynthesis protein